MKVIKRNIIAITILSILLSLNPYSNTIAEASTSTMYWNLQTSTALNETNDCYKMMIGDYNGDNINDLFVVLKNSTSDNMAEIHILDGSDNYQSYLLHSKIKIPTSQYWDFQLGDYNNDGKLDLYCILQSSSSSTYSELHILNGSDDYQSFLLQKQLPLTYIPDNWYFRLGNVDGDSIPDLYCIQGSQTGSGMTEVHALSGSEEYSNYALHQVTTLGTIGDNWDFALNDYDSDGIDDLYCICKNGTGSSMTEVHVLSGLYGFGTYLLQLSTLLDANYTNFEFALGDGQLDLYCIKKSGTGSGTTEIHELIYSDGTTSSSSQYVTASQLTQLGWTNVTTTMVNDLNSCLKKYNITTQASIRHFITQCTYESGYGIYTLEIADGSAYEGSTDLGNIYSGDGTKFKGAGYLQLTGRYNYTAFANSIGDQQIVAQGATYVAANYPWSSAGFWWYNNDMTTFCTNGATVRQVTLKVNGGTKTVPERQAIYTKVCTIF